MSTTSLKLSTELKERAVAAAEQLGVSTHAFMVGAINQATEATEQRAEFIAQAQTALAEMQESGVGYDADNVRAYMLERLSKGEAVKPKAKPWRK